jgi:hypothetical protein
MPTRWMLGRLGSVKAPDSSEHDWQDRRDQRARLWEHALHQDGLFLQRGSFFLVVESLLVVAYTAVLRSLSGTEGLPFRLRLAALVLAAFGFLLTVLWAYDSIRQRYWLTYLQKRIEKELPEYRHTVEERKLSGGRFSSSTLMAFGVPLLASVMWLIFLTIAI